jgi:hypothetical protein
VQHWHRRLPGEKIALRSDGGLVNPSHAYDPDLHEPGTLAASGHCSHHGHDRTTAETCTGEAVVSFQDRRGRWQSGCSAALEQLVDGGEIQPLGQGA